MLFESLGVGPLQVNCYIIADPDTRNAIIIDPGGDLPGIVATIDRLSLTPARIVTTHCDMDHILAIGALQEKYDIPFWAHRDAPHFLENCVAAGRALGGYSLDQVPMPDVLFDAGENVAVDSIELIAYHTPGHSPDSCTFLGSGICVSGDVVFAGSVGRWDLPCADFEALMNSIREVYLDLPDATPIYPGHGPATTMGRERLRNPFVRALAAGYDPAALFG